MQRLFFVTHPEVIVDPAIPVDRWRLSDRGIARMRYFAGRDDVRGVRAIWASIETKAIVAAEILGERLGLDVNRDAGLGENDRSATGFLPPDVFERTADRFFAAPTTSIDGWERAIDAQHRIRTTVETILARHAGGDIAIVAHGAVGTLLWCAFAGRPIDRAADQPFQGHVWTADLSGPTILTGWEPIAPREALGPEALGRAALGESPHGQ